LTDEQEADEFVQTIARDWQAAKLNAPDRALCEYAEKLTLLPWTVDDRDIDELRELGFDDSAIHDATQVISYFNYITRVADGLAVDHEDFIRSWES